MLKKKAQKSGSQAAVLVGIIAILLIAYILFLPPEDREMLLEDDDGTGIFSQADEENVTILNVTSMRLDYVGQNNYEHRIANVYLFETTEGGVLEELTPFYVRNGWFDKRKENFTFYIDDIENTDKVALSFEAPKAKGRLLISLNGVQVFDYEVSQLNVGPVELKKELLKEGENYLYFEASGVGAKFWSTNEYSIEDAKITADFTDISRQESENIFTVTNEEYYNLEESKLEFYPICTQDAVGRLNVMVNNRQVFSAVPDCESINRVDIFSTDLNPGKNTISFSTAMGSYRIELIKVKTELRDVKTYLDYFGLNNTAYNELRAGDKRVDLFIEFVDDDEDKEAEININGHLTYLDQKNPSYSKNIGPWIEKGARNYIEITPKTVLKIVEVRVVLSDKE